MKKVSLLTCLLAIALSGSAQMKNVKQLTATTQNKAVSTVNIGGKQKAMPTAQKADAAMRSQLVNEAPRRSVASGVYYNRPSGSYLLSWTKDWGGWSADAFFGVPIGDNIVENACNEPEKATWSIITSASTIDLEGEEETNNLNLNGYKYSAETDTYDNGFNMFYPPTITVGNDSYTFGETNESGGVYAIAGRPTGMSKATMQSAYSGWSDGGYIYGTKAGDISYDFDDDGTAEHYVLDGIWQIHEAPLSPLYVEDIYLLGRNSYSLEDPDRDLAPTIPEGTEIHLYVTNVDRSNGGAWPGDQIIADLTCTAEDIMPIEYNGSVVAYSFVFAKKEVDFIGNEAVVPFVLSDEYALIIDWNIEGVDINIAGNSFSRTDDDVYARVPSYMILTDDAGQTQYTTLSYNNVTCTPVFTAMYDYAKVYDVLYSSVSGEEFTDMNVLTAPVEGGKIWESTAEDVNVYAYCETALPWYDETESENYFIVNMPDWVTNYVVEEDTQGEDASGFTFVSFEVEPLPADVKGRKAEVNIQGKGFTSDPIIIVQGEVSNEPTLTDGKYYLKNVAAGKFWGAGNSWGTQASLLDHAEYVTLAQQPDGAWTLESQVSNGGENYYFGGDYMDGAPINLTITNVNDNIYTIANEAGELFGSDGSTVLGKNVAAGEAAQWQILTEDDLRQQLAAATETAPADATFLILDPNFGRNNRNQDAWSMEASNKNLSGGNNSNNNAESYHSVFTLSQVLENVPNGVYGLTAQGFYRQDGSDNDNLPYFYINDEKTTIPVKTGSENSMSDASNSFTNGLYKIEPIYVKVENGTITLGAKLEENTNLWVIWDNFELTYYGANADINSLKNAAIIQKLADLRQKATTQQDQVNNDVVKKALADALAATANVNGSSALTDIEAAIATLSAAIDLADANITAQTVIPAMKALVDATNVYTKEALDEYFTKWNDKYEAGTLTKDEANALQNPEIVTGWHAAITVDEFLLSAWDTNPNFVDAPYYINTWSVEGDSDGSNFRVPFFEYWTGDGDSLGERTLTATMTGLENGEYEVTSWTRVRTKNNTGAYTSGEGIFLQVNDGKAVDAAKGDSKYELGADNNFFVGNVAAKGNVTDGTLNIKYIVAAENNISWLSFKNVFFKRIGDVNGINTVNAAAEQNNQMFNLQGQKVEKADKGLYIVNGKKVVVK